MGGKRRKAGNLLAKNGVSCELVKNLTFNTIDAAFNNLTPHGTQSIDVLPR